MPGGPAGAGLSPGALAMLAAGVVVASLAGALGGGCAITASSTRRRRRSAAPGDPTPVEPTAEPAALLNKPGGRPAQHPCSTGEPVQGSGLEMPVVPDAGAEVAPLGHHRPGVAPANEPLPPPPNSAGGFFEPRVGGAV